MSLASLSQDSILVYPKCLCMDKCTDKLMLGANHLQFTKDTVYMYQAMRKHQ